MPTGTFMAHFDDGFRVVQAQADPDKLNRCLLRSLFMFYPLQKDKREAVAVAYDLEVAQETDYGICYLGEL